MKLVNKHKTMEAALNTGGFTKYVGNYFTLEPDDTPGPNLVGCIVAAFTYDSNGAELNLNSADIISMIHKQYPGSSLNFATGGYKIDDGYVLEDSFILSVHHVACDATLGIMSEWIRQELRQESVIMCLSDGTAVFNVRGKLTNEWR